MGTKRKMVERFGLHVPTAALHHQLPGLLTIDHIAVGQGFDVVCAKRIDAIVKGGRLSDHDAYVVEIE